MDYMRGKLDPEARRPRFVWGLALAGIVVAGCGSTRAHVETSPVSAAPVTVAASPSGQVTSTTVAQWFVRPSAAAADSTATAIPAPQVQGAPVVLGPNAEPNLSVRASGLAADLLQRLPAGYTLAASADQQQPDGTIIHRASFRAADGIGVIGVRWQQLTSPWPILPNADTPNQDQLGSYSKTRAGETLVLNGNPPDQDIMFVTPSGSLVTVMFTVDPKAFRAAHPGQAKSTYAGIGKDALVAIAQASAA